MGHEMQNPAHLPGAPQAEEEDDDKLLEKHVLEAEKNLLDSDQESSKKLNLEEGGTSTDEDQAEKSWRQEQREQQKEKAEIHNYANMAMGSPTQDQSSINGITKIEPISGDVDKPKLELLKFAQKFQRLYRDFEMRNNSAYDAPSEVFLVTRQWFEDFKVYIQYSSIKSYHFDEQEYLQNLTEEHMKTMNPGKIINAGILKSFEKYIRTDDIEDSSNFVLKRKIANQEGIEYYKLPHSCWNMLASEFNYDYEIKRERDKDTYSMWTKYKFAHDFVKVLILPPYENFTEDEINSFKPLKLYYTQKTTFRDMKEKIAKYLTAQKGKKYESEQFRFWKPSFFHASKSKFITFLEKQGLTTDLSRQRQTMDRLVKGDLVPEEMKENPQAEADDIEQDDIEQNSGVQFPGLQLDQRMNHKFTDFQKTADGFSSMEMLIVEQAQVIIQQEEEIKEPIEPIQVAAESPAASAKVVKKPRLQFIFSYDKCTGEIARCDGCYQMKMLRVKCPCGKADYCSQSCRRQDENWHSSRCDYVAQVDLTKADFSKSETNAAKGVMGLRNMGNTCYMNSAVQCLSNMALLRQYFLTMRFRDEINMDNPLGSKGDVVARFGELLYSLWGKTKTTGGYSYSYYSNAYEPTPFKKAIGKANQMFKGTNQQDSMEFINWMLDQLHEDLNRVKNKKYIEMPDLAGNDKQVSNTFWEAHLTRNQSIIVDLMQGQFKSTVTCPTCNFKKVTFDPFTSVQLPIPTITKVNYFFVCPNPETEIFQGELTFPASEADEPFMNVKQRIAVQASEFHKRDIQPYDFVISLVNRDKFRIMCLLDDTATQDARALQINPSNEYIFVYEIEKRALRPNHNHGLASNYQEPAIQEETQPLLKELEDEESTYVSKKSAKNDDPNMFNPFESSDDDEKFTEMDKGMLDQKKTDCDPNDKGIVDEYEETKMPPMADDGPIHQVQFDDDDNVKDTKSQLASDTYPGNSNKKYNYGQKLQDQFHPKQSYKTPTKKKPNRVFDDELKDKPIPIPKALKEIMKENWVKIPVVQTRREKQTTYNHWGYNAHKGRYENAPVSPRLMWFNLDWTMAEVHKQLIGKYLYMLKFDQDSDAPTYEEVFGLTQDDPHALLREEHTDLNRTNLPFMVNFVNPFQDQWGYNSKCRLCGNDSSKCENCPVPYNHEVTLRQTLEHACHKTKFQMNDYLFGQNQNQGAIGKWDNDSDEEAALEDKKINWDDEENWNQQQNYSIQDDDDIAAKEKKKQEEAENPIQFESGRHKVFQFEIIFIVENFQYYDQRSKPKELMNFKDHPRMMQQAQNQTIQNSCTLDSCLHKFRQAEQLGKDDTWYCSKCKDHVLATKQIEMYKCGPVLILSFNRFKQHNIMFNEKMEDSVNFPIYNLDMSQHILSHSDGQEDDQQEKLIYDLFGVVNHYGSLNFGHYTAFAKNSETGQWHKYDDENVQSCDAYDVVTEAAYVLFYQLRSAAPQPTTKIEELYAKLKQQPMFNEPFSPSKIKNVSQSDSEQPEESPLARKIVVQSPQKTMEEKKDELKEEAAEPGEKGMLDKKESIPDTKGDEELAKLLAAQMEQEDEYNYWNDDPQDTNMLGGQGASPMQVDSNNQQDNLNQDLNYGGYMGPGPTPDYPQYEEVELDNDQALKDNNTAMMNQMNPTLNLSPGLNNDYQQFGMFDDDVNQASPAPACPANVSMGSNSNSDED